jgi:hypothetical protein
MSATITAIDIVRCGHCKTPYVRIREKTGWFAPCHGNGLATVDGHILRCATCSKACGLMPREIAAFVTKIVETFDTQSDPPPADCADV